MIFNLNAGNIVAKLRVKFPPGSTVTITGNGLTFTARNESGDTEYTFMIPFPGDWVIAIVTPDGITTTQTVAIVPGVNQAVAPAVKQYLFNNGDQCVAVTGGWERWGTFGDLNNNQINYGADGDNSGGIVTKRQVTVPAWAKYWKGIGMHNGTSNSGSIWLRRSKDLNPQTRVICLSTDSLANGVWGTVSSDVSSVVGQSLLVGEFIYGPHEGPSVNVHWKAMWFESDTAV